MGEKQVGHLLWEKSRREQLEGSLSLSLFLFRLDVGKRVSVQRQAWHFQDERGAGLALVYNHMFIYGVAINCYLCKII